MLNHDQADRIASAIQVVRPDWNHKQLMGVLGMDDIKLRRTYVDTFHAMLAIALDGSTKQPTRVLEPGPWWAASTDSAIPPNTSDLLPTHADDDCRECGQPATHWTHFDTTDRGCAYLSPSAWAERARAADHHAKAAEVRQQMRQETSA